MESIKESEMLLIMGGQLSECEQIIAEGNRNSNNPEFNWDRWAEAFEDICGQ